MNQSHHSQKLHSTETDKEDTSQDEAYENTSNSDAYATPRSIIRPLQEALPDQYGNKFDLDPAALPGQTHIAHETFTKDDDGLSLSWEGLPIQTIWLNPPYSDPKPFLKRIVQYVDPDQPMKADLGFALVRCDPGTSWYREYITKAQYLCLIERRITFDNCTNSADFSNLLAAYGDVPQSIIDILERFGTVVDLSTTDNTKQASLTDISRKLQSQHLITVSYQDQENETRKTEIHVTDLTQRDQIIVEFEEPAYLSTPAKAYLKVLRTNSNTNKAHIDAYGKTETGEQICIRIDIANETRTVMGAIGSNEWEALPDIQSIHIL